jgi:phospholipase/carboxylesterase
MSPLENPSKVVKQKAPAFHPSFSLDSALFSPPRPDTSRVMFTPLHYEPNYAYPLVIWLHGPGNTDERQLLRIMPMISLRNYVAVAPRGFHCDGQEPNPTSYDWPQTAEHIEEAENRVFDCIEAAQRRWRMSDKRVFLAGFDVGGTMAFRVAMNHPRQFAGVVSLCGAFPTGQRPLVQLLEARRLPVFLAVGRDSERYPPNLACEDLRLFHTGGISVTLRQYPCGQQIAPQMLRDIDRWVIDQVTNASEVSSVSR